MVFVFKKSATPLIPWSAVRHGGINNLSAGVRGKYLVLMNFDVVHREGAWHYIFQFDARNSLETSGLAKVVGEASRYPNDIDWRQWLGDGFEVISASVREAILNMPADEAKTEMVITGMREVPNARPIPGRNPSNAFQFELPREFMLALPALP
jgi:hypothetical protein